MLSLLPPFESTVHLTATGTEEDVRSRLEGETLWLEREPSLKWQRVGYTLKWFLLPDLPATERTFVGYRQKDAVMIYRVPGMIQTSFWPSGTISMETQGEHTEVMVSLRVDRRARRAVQLTEVAFFLMGSVVGRGLAEVLFPGSPLAWLGVLLGLIFALLHALMAGGMFKREVRTFREALTQALSTRRSEAEKT